MSEALRLGKKGSLVCAKPWIESWQPQNENLPATIEEIELEYARLVILNEPCPLEQGIVVMEHTLELYGKPDNWDRTAEFYLEAIEDLPIDVLVDTMRTVRNKVKWFPKVSEIRGYIDRVHWARKNGETKLRLMIKKAMSNPQLAYQRLA